MFPMPAALEETGSLVQWLKSLGLTKYEALVYIALLRVSDATATGIHAISGVPRASVYPVLSQLQDRGLVAISPSSPRRFAALPPDEGIGSLLSRIEEDATHARDALGAIYRQRMASERPGEELIWNLYGIAAIRTKLIELIGQAEKSIRIMAHSTLSSPEVRGALTAKAGQIPVEIFIQEPDKPFPQPMVPVVKGLPEDVSRLPMARDMLAGGICVIDDRKIFVVIGSGDEDAVALYSESEGFVRFFSRYYSLIRDLDGTGGQ